MPKHGKQLFSDNLFGSALEYEQLLDDDGLVDVSQKLPEVLSADPTLVRTERLHTEKQEIVPVSDFEHLKYLMKVLWLHISHQ